MSAITLYGIAVSPYVRKVSLALRFKNIPFEQVPVIPIGDDQPEEFKQNSPLGKIPLLSVGGKYLADSSVMCAWLERAHPTPALLPEGDFDAAQALWFEEYADSHMQAVIGGHLFAEVVLAKAVFHREPIQADIDLAIGTEIPAILSYLESQLQGEYLVGQAFSLADLSVGNVLMTLRFCDYQCDAGQWPKTAAYMDRLNAMAIFQQAITECEQLMKSMSQ